MIDYWMTGLVGWLGDRLLDVLTWLTSLLTTGIFLHPDVTVLPQVTTLSGKSALVVGAGYGLAIITAGVLAMAGDSLQVRYGLKELIPRLIVGFVLSAFATPLCRALIGVGNALTTAMVGTATPTGDALTMIRTHLVAALTEPGTAVIATLVGATIVALTVLLIAGWAVRVATLVILAGLAPLALACYGLPATQPAAGLWWRTLLGCLATATLQAVTFSTGVQLLLDPGANLPVLLGIPGSDLVNLLLVLVLLWMTVKIPALVRRFVATAPSRTNLFGIVIRAVTVQSMTRRLLRRPATPAPRVDMSTHTHHHYRRLRRVVLNGGRR